MTMRLDSDTSKYHLKPALITIIILL